MTSEKWSPKGQEFFQTKFMAEYHHNTTCHPTRTLHRSFKLSRKQLREYRCQDESSLTEANVLTLLEKLIDIQQATEQVLKAMASTEDLEQGCSTREQPWSIPLPFDDQ
jgi:ribosomal protein S14